MPDSDPYILQLTQSWRGKDAQGDILPLHWALTIKTAGSLEAPLGNIYNAAGNIDTFYYETIYNVPLKNANWRGDLPVGIITRDALPLVENLFAWNEVVRRDCNWNCQNWVYTALRELRRASYDIKPLTLDSLRSQMMDLLDAWESGDI